MSLLMALIDKAVGNSLGAKSEIASSVFYAASDVANVADGILDNVPGYSKTKDIISSKIENAKTAREEKEASIEYQNELKEKEASFERKLSTIENRLNSFEEKCVNAEKKWNQKTIVEKIKVTPVNPLAVLLGDKGLDKLIKINPENTKIVACGTRGGKTHSHLFDPLPMITWRNMFFEFYDSQGNVLYSIKGKESYIGKCFNLHIKDGNGVLVAEVQEDLLAMRVPIIHEWEPHNYSLFVKGKKIGTIKTAFKGPSMDKKYNLIIKNVKYEATRNIANSKFVVKDLKHNEVLKINGVSAFTLPLDYCYAMDISKELSSDEAVTIFAAMLASAFSSQK